MLVKIKNRVKKIKRNDKIRPNDNVIVIAGKNKGKLGTVTRIFNNGYVLVDGINLVYKHIKSNPQRGQEGKIIRKEAPVHVSNVALYNAAIKKADRVGIKILSDGKKFATINLLKRTFDI